jgi:hypothetical protein
LQHGSFAGAGRHGDDGRISASGEMRANREQRAALRIPKPGRLIG